MAEITDVFALLLGSPSYLFFFSGYIADTLRWCGDINKPDGVATDTVCPSYDTSEDCPMSAERAFWLLASQQASKPPRTVTRQCNLDLVERYFYKIELGKVGIYIFLGFYSKQRKEFTR